MLDPEFKKKWVAALKSGNLEQNRGSLRDKLQGGKYAYCCLGVACQISDPDKWVGTYYDNKCLFLTDEFLNKINLSIHEMNQLTHMNDKGSSFKEIAEYIERNL